MADDRDVDRDLEAALQSRSGGDVDVTDAFASVSSRATTIRRRRLAVSTSAVAIIAIGGIALLPRSGDRDLVPADQVPGVEDPGDSAPTTGPARSDDESSDDQGGAPDDSVERADTTPTSTTPATAGDANPLVVDNRPPETTATTLPATPTGTPTTTGAPSAAPSPTTSSPSAAVTTTVGTATPTSSASTTVATTTPTTATPTTPASSTPASTTALPTTSTATVAPFTKTYSSAGGSITVSWNGSALSLQSVAPAVGFEAEVEDSSAMRVRVRFRGEPDDARIEIRISDGRLVEEIS